MADYPFITPLDEDGNPIKIEAPPPRGLGGWLALIGTSLALGIAFKTYALFQVIALVSSPAWERLTRASYESYDPLWGPFMLFDLSAGSLLLSLNAVVLYLFFKKKGLFISTFILYMFASMAAGVVDAVFISSIGNADRTLFNMVVIRVFLLAIYTLIWWPYVKVSVRAKNTFTN